MRKIFNIRLKDVANARLYAIKAIKDEFNIGLKEAKDMVDDILEKGELVATIHRHSDDRYDFFGEEAWRVEPVIRETFDCEFLDDTPRNEYGYVIHKPDPETALALNWYEGLSDEEKRKIDLLAIWMTPICVAG